MRVLDLFAGIGGFSLAAHWMGWETAAFVEFDKDCQKVLRKNFPNVPVYGDITQFHYEQERDRIGPVDLVCGGFPCQPFSSAGKRKGAGDDRYLWPEMLRTIREVRPSWVVGENVAGLVTMDGGRVLDEICTSLEDEGYQVEAFIIPACAVGAPHRRDRFWIVGNTQGFGKEAERTIFRGQESNSDGVNGSAFTTPHTTRQQAQPSEPGGLHAEFGGEDWFVANADGHQYRADRREDRKKNSLPEVDRAGKLRSGNSSGTVGIAPNPDNARMEGLAGHGSDGNESGWNDEEQDGYGKPGDWGEHWLQVATRLCRVDDGLPSWVDRHRTRRLKQLGNSIVPQVVYEIYRAIQVNRYA